MAYLAYLTFGLFWPGPFRVLTKASGLLGYTCVSKSSFIAKCVTCSRVVQVMHLWQSRPLTREIQF